MKSIREFNGLILDLNLIDISMKNDLYTWSSGRENPSATKIDRFLISQWHLVSKILSFLGCLVQPLTISLCSFTLVLISGALLHFGSKICGWKKIVQIS